MIVKCSNCNCDLERDSWAIERTKNFYCSECLKKRKKTITVKCNKCGKELDLEPYKAKRNKHHFCSNCRIRNSHPIEGICPVCGNKFNGNKTKIFCSKKCSRKQYISDPIINQKIKKSQLKSRFPAKEKLKYCDTCGKPFYSKGNRKNCSRKCYMDSFTKKWREENHDEIILKSKKYYTNNKEQLLTVVHEYYQKNKTMIKKYKKKYRRDNPNIAKEINIKASYGLIKEDYDLLFKQQSGKCAICKNEIVSMFDLKNKTTAHIDHDHKTGKIRGLLCFQCNHGLGNFRDKEKFLLSAIQYLKNSNK